MEVVDRLLELHVACHVHLLEIIRRLADLLLHVAVAGISGGRKGLRDLERRKRRELSEL